MKNGKYTARRTSGTKVFALLLSLVLVLGCAIGGTLAWLTAQTTTVTNTFTVGDINIDLKEHKYLPDSNTLDSKTEVTSNDNYKMVPGYTMPKDPFVTVKAGSENCYVFVKVEKSDNFDTFMSCEMASGWTQLMNGETAVDGVYYRSVESNATTDQDFYILMGGETVNISGFVTVNSGVTKAQLDAVGENKPTISFTAYAIQMHKNNNETFTPIEAWQAVSTPAT